jgi:S1-C subfamily serine protease
MKGGNFMQHLNEHDLLTRPDTSLQGSMPLVTRPKRSTLGLRTAVIVALTVPLAVVFGVGLFAGWVYGTRSTGVVTSSAGPTAPIPPVTVSGTTLDAVREAVVAKVRPSVVQVNVVTSNGKGLGSGVIIDSRGYIITNNHVIATAQSIQVVLYDGMSFPAQLIGTDPLDDLAVLKVTPTSKLIAATFGDSSKVRVGQEVLAIGNPLGITQTVTDGIISALDRTVSTIPDAIQTDAAINPGNSGGALVDLQGNLIGIPTLSAIDPQFQTPANGVGFAIPSNRVQLIASQLITSGKVTHTGRIALGIKMTNVDAALAAQNSLSVTSGVLITKIAPNGPASEAGLKAGDVMVQVGQHAVTDVVSLREALVTLKPGENVAVKIYRGSKQMTVNVTLGEASAS